MRRRGLAAVSPERRRQIAAKGARALRRKGKAHTFTSAEAKAAAQLRHNKEDEQPSVSANADLQSGPSSEENR